jgi:hypothetical protein
VFAVEFLFLPTQSVVQMERVFRQEFDALRYGRVPKWDTVLKIMNNPYVHATSRFVQNIQSFHRPGSIERVQQKRSAQLCINN